jgi:hypothetical protein
MPQTLTVNNQPFETPIDGDPPGWGEQTSEWMAAVTDTLDELQGANDIPQTSFTVQNDISSAENVTGLSFNTGQVRSASIAYSVYRVSTAAPSGNSESGTMEIIYDNAAGAGSKWQMSVFGIAGNSGVSFTITDLGQVQYTSTDIDSVGYSGTMRFAAKSLTSV